MAVFLRIVLVLALAAGAYLLVSRPRGKSVPTPDAPTAPAPENPRRPVAEAPADATPARPLETPAQPPAIEPPAAEAEATQPALPDLSKPIPPSEVAELFPRAVAEMAADRGVDGLELQVQLLDRIARGETTKERVVRDWVTEKVLRANQEKTRAMQEALEKVLAEREVAELRKETAAADAMVAIAGRVQTFYDRRVRLPRDLKEMQSQESFGVLDPWENEYRYEVVKGGYARGFRLVSAGRDGKLGTPDDLAMELEARPASAK